MSNPSYEFIESAIIFGLTDYEKLKNFAYHSNDFAKHGDAFKFIGEYLDKYEGFPTEQVLIENFPTLNPSAKTQSLEYSVDIFKNQVLQRAVVSTVQQQRELVKDGLMGIPTSFNFINQGGIGWMPGELIAAFARPTVGKTWLCVHSAATAVHNGFKTLLISTEMPNTQIAMRLDVTLAKMKGYNFSHRALRHGEEIDVEAYIKFLKEANTQSLLICDGVSGKTGISLESIAGLVRKHNPKFVVIDGVYLLTTRDTDKAAWEQSHGIFYGLKNLAISTNTPIMVSTQANRDAGNVYVPPSAAQVAFGDALIRSSDVAVALAKVENHDDKRLIQFQKYRDGELAIDQIVMQWSVNNGTIEEISDFDWDNDEF